ncbi:unnamed protein product [Sympodiomycopsis kandeliae]
MPAFWFRKPASTSSNNNDNNHDTTQIQAQEEPTRQQVYDDGSFRSRSNGAADAIVAPPTESLVKRPPLLGIASVLFVASFTGAAIYGVRAGRRAQLREAAEQAQQAQRQVNKSITPRSSPLPSTSSPLPSSSAGKLDWGAAGTSAPSVLSRSGRTNHSAGHHESDARSSSSPNGQTQAQTQELIESPALTAIKAFSIATGIVAVTTLISIEVGRRIYDIQDMYDLTDRLSQWAPKSFRLFESIGSYCRDRMSGIIPRSEENLHSDPLHEPLPHLDPQGEEIKTVDEVWNEMSEKDSLREKLKVVELHLRMEKQVQDRYREEIRLQRETAKSV